ncbi:Amino acid/polyamine/organocation transporter, APC superfamily [Candidatus Sulfotelmatobacter kueseliae]|uniref:Amino acid/polyamine/organocation transporter, APC superfamily n=1 Tax=Candidatus Sulfotelmatobacter kueseliae TaxID=2042962 RepID=A0A2U3L5I7_9BACT|nr:Amino acid/polyamine/organocation transporter, APC superfamily [Candidatus Sulfotelmatobacter kueseliae]
MSATPQSAAQPHLIRALGRRDLVLLFVVAVFNLNVVPSIAANGGVTVWLWIISLLLFFWPQGIAVIELAHRYPGEGGVYLWAKEVFGDFHGFLSGWCYWTNNMLYVPTVMLYFVGVSVYVLGPGHQGLADNKLFASTTSLALLALLTLFNILGLGVGKWINNLGAIGTFVAAAVLIGLGIVIWTHFGTTLTAADFAIPANPKFVLNSFGVICFGLVGLELASVMGDEIKDPRRTLPGAVAWGGVISGALYVGATLTLLIAVGKSVNVLQGIVQAVTHMAGRVGVGWITIPFALLLSLSIAGIGSAWMGGSARIPFVAGLDSYMPSWLGNVHPRYRTPYAALILQGIVSAVLVILNFTGAGVQETFQKLLSLAVVLQLVPFVYMFGALVKFAVTESTPQGQYGRATMLVAGVSGFLTTILGIAMVFFPAQQISSLLWYEIWMVGGTLFFIGLAAFFFFVYGRRKVTQATGVEATDLGNARSE